MIYRGVRPGSFGSHVLVAMILLAVAAIVRFAFNVALDWRRVIFVLLVYVVTGTIIERLKKKKATNG